MQSYEERATQQEKVGGPKPSETNKFTQARQFHHIQWVFQVNQTCIYRQLVQVFYMVE
jgi:hypothetical protein